MKTLDDVFTLFTEERRRFTLYYLKNADGAVSVEELAANLYEWEENGTRETIPDGELREMILTLEHNHLPKIEEATHVEYDRTNEQVRITGLSTEADILLSVTEALEHPAKSSDFIAGRFG